MPYQYWTWHFACFGSRIEQITFLSIFSTLFVIHTLKQPYQLYVLIVLAFPHAIQANQGLQHLMFFYDSCRNKFRRFEHTNYRIQYQLTDATDCTQRLNWYRVWQKSGSTIWQINEFINQQVEVYSCTKALCTSSVAFLCIHYPLPFLTILLFVVWNQSIIEWCRTWHEAKRNRWKHATDKTAGVYF